MPSSRDVRSSREVVAGPGFVVRSVVCAEDHLGWSGPEDAVDVQVVLVRRGRFRRAARGRVFTVDPTIGYVQRPGVAERFAHPAGGDVCTSVTLTGEALTAGSWLHDAVHGDRQAVRVDARLELAHRMLTGTGSDPGFAGAEAVLNLLARAVGGTPDEPWPRPGLAERAREALAAGAPEAADLVGLAALLGTSPWHLSRTFRRHTGMTLTRYRNRIRVSRALQLLESGTTDLSALAADLGFSDQPHFARTVRRELGHTPGRLRSLLGPARHAARPEKRPPPRHR